MVHTWVRSLLLGIHSLSIISTTNCGITRLPSAKLLATVLSENLGETMRGSCVAESTNVLLSSHLYLYIYIPTLKVSEWESFLYGCPVPETWAGFARNFAQ